VAAVGEEFQVLFVLATLVLWSPDLIGIENWNTKDPGSTVLRWDEKLRRYIEEK